MRKEQQVAIPDAALFEQRLKIIRTRIELFFGRMNRFRWTWGTDYEAQSAEAAMNITLAIMFLEDIEEMGNNKFRFEDVVASAPSFTYTDPCTCNMEYDESLVGGLLRAGRRE